MTIVEAKSVLRIPELWKRLSLSGSPARSCNAPWREDRTPSFSVSQDGKLWNDFATGEGGDAVAFLQKARGLDRKAACSEFLRLAAGGLETAESNFTNFLPPKRTLYLPQLRSGTAGELQSLGRLRGLSVEGLSIAQDAGVLSFADLKGHLAWVISDSTARNFQARRLDGKTWTHIGEKKAWTLPGSQAAWPLGILNAASFNTILLCEGGPDLLAAFHFLAATNRQDLFPVAMLGAGLRIHREALEHFAAKHVRIFPHIDGNAQGYKAAARWQSQLESVNAVVDAYSFAGLTTAAGIPVKDLNDCVKMDQQTLESLNLWEGL